MKVSIIMLVYNHERFIEQALDSVLMQQVNFDYELIIGEDASTDHTKIIINKYEEKFQGKLNAIFREENVGTIRNLLDCLRRCQGEYIAFLEGDDYWTDKFKLQKQVDFLEKNPQYSTVAHNYKIVNLSDEFMGHGLQNQSVYEFDKRDLEQFKLPSQTSTLLIRNISSQVLKEDIKIINKYAWLPGDRIFFLSLLKRGKIAILPEVMSAYRYYIEADGTNWSSQNEIAATENYFYFFKVICGVEKLSAEMEFPIDMMNVKVNHLHKAITARRWSKHKIKLYFQCIQMILIEPHKFRFIKAVAKSFF